MEGEDVGGEGERRGENEGILRKRCRRKKEKEEEGQDEGGGE